MPRLVKIGDASIPGHTLVFTRTVRPDGYTNSEWKCLRCSYTWKRADLAKLSLRKGCFPEANNRFEKCAATRAVRTEANSQLAYAGRRWVPCAGVGRGKGKQRVKRTEDETFADMLNLNLGQDPGGNFPRSMTASSSSGRGSLFETTKCGRSAPGAPD